MRNGRQGWLIALGVIVIGFGVWMVFRPADNDTATDNTESSTGEGDSATGSTTSNGDEQSNSAGSLSGLEQLDELTMQTLPPSSPVLDPVAGECNPDYEGLGIEMRPWGDVRLPYTLQYPTNEPGEVWDCTPNTPFGAAIAMAHGVYLASFRPDALPDIAVDNAGRRLLMANLANNPDADLGYSCSPLGWNWNGDSTWSILHQCGDDDPQLTYVDMVWANNRWWITIPDGGVFEANSPPADYQYYPYEGGDV